MQFCDDHWTRLREAIQVRGLWKFVASKESIVGAMAAGSFEPLMGAHNAIIANLVDAGGVGIIVNQGCPLCTAIAVHKEACQKADCHQFEDWIDRAADDQLARAKELGLAVSASG